MLNFLKGLQKRTVLCLAL